MSVSPTIWRWSMKSPPLLLVLQSWLQKSATFLWCLIGMFLLKNNSLLYVLSSHIQLIKTEQKTQNTLDNFIGSLKSSDDRYSFWYKFVIRSNIYYQKGCCVLKHLCNYNAFFVEQHCALILQNCTKTSNGKECFSKCD